MNQNQRRFIMVLLGLIVLLSIAKSFYITEKFGGTDLRCRIVGSRLLLTGNSPYFYKWHPGDDIRYLDPNNKPYRQVNGNVVTPALLLLNKPLSLLPYRLVRISWTFIQYCLFVLTLFFIWKVNDSRKDILLPITIVLFGFLMSDIWFYNVERGQTYVLYAFIFSCCYISYNKEWKYNHLLSGVIAGMAIWIRPLFLLIHIPFLLVKDFRWMIGSVIGFSAGLLIFFIPLQKSWNEYKLAIAHYEMEAVGEESYIMTNDTITKPKNIEGVSNLTLYREGMKSGGINIKTYLKDRNILLDAKSSGIAFLILLAFLSFLFLRHSKIIFQKKSDLFLFAFLLYMLSELFITGGRAGYNMMEWLFVYCIMLIEGNINIVVTSLLVLGIGFMNGWPFSFPHQNEIGEAIAFYVLSDFIFIHKISGNSPHQVFQYESIMHCDEEST
jgi:Glycosyltransferase family 87